MSLFLLKLKLLILKWILFKTASYCHEIFAISTTTYWIISRSIMATEGCGWWLQLLLLFPELRGNPFGQIKQNPHGLKACNEKVMVLSHG